METIQWNQGDEVGGSNERCPLTSNFDAKNSQSKAELAFDCHILARQAVIKLIVQRGKHR